MSQEQGILAALNTDAASYLRQASIVVTNKINPRLGTTLSLTLAQFYITPGGGSWDKPAPEQGEQINFGGNPGQWAVSNDEYPGKAEGQMVFAVQSNATLTLDFHSTLTGIGATINGSSRYVIIGGFYFTLETTLNPSNSQPIFTVTAEQYRP